jgi:hypothetical protein
MYYDLNNHRYVLKPEYFRDQYSIELIDQLDTSGSINARQAVEGLLKRASMMIYNYIYQHNPHQKDYFEYRLVKYSSMYRNGVKEAMGELVYFWLTNNNDLSIQTGINIDLGKIFDRIDINRNVIPQAVELILSRYDIITRAKWRLESDSNYSQDKDDKGIDW